jgi:hypothetical protein
MARQMLRERAIGLSVSALLPSSSYMQGLVDPALKQCHALPPIPHKTRNGWGT